jgi:ArsR family transcriptional regulator
VGTLTLLNYLYIYGDMEKHMVISALAALAQETRLDVFRTLVEAGPEGLPAGSIGAALDIPSATLSFHLKELRSAGLVRCERQGRSRIYSPDFSITKELIGFLTANCCQGADGIGAAGEGCGLDSGSPAQKDA